MAEDKLSFLDEPDVTEAPAEAPELAEAAEPPASPQTRDDKGRFAAAQHEGTGETTDAPPASEPKQDQHTAPIAAVTAEREKRQAAERALDELRRQTAERERMFMEMVQARQAPQQRQPEPEPVQAPDPVEDPHGFAAFVQQQAQMAMAQQTQAIDGQMAAFSQQVAVEKYGAEAVDAALAWAKQAGVVDRFRSGIDRWSRLVAAHKQQQVLGEVGDDLGAFRSRVETDLRQSLEAEIRAKVLAELNVSPAPPSAPPPSLAGAPSFGAPRPSSGSAFDQAFG